MSSFWFAAAAVCQQLTGLTDSPSTWAVVNIYCDFTFSVARWRPCRCWWRILSTSHKTGGYFTIFTTNWVAKWSCKLTNIVCVIQTGWKIHSSHVRSKKRSHETNWRSGSVLFCEHSRQVAVTNSNYTSITERDVVFILWQTVQRHNSGENIHFLNSLMATNVRYKSLKTYFVFTVFLSFFCCL